MQKIKWSFVLKTMFAITVFVSSSCDKKKDDASQDAGYTGVAAVALTNIEGVQSNYAPDSMQTTTTSNSVISPLAVDFCESKNFYACQPKLVKLYIAITKSYLSLMRVFLAGFSQGLSNIQDGDTNNDGSDIDAYTSIAYSKTSATQFSILARAKADASTYFYFSSNATTYNLQIDFSKVPAAKRAASDPTQGKVNVTLNYTDNSHWTLSLFAYDFACNESDPKAPERIKIIMHKSDTIWNGKAMLANARSMKGDEQSNPVTCTSDATDTNSSNYYTEFVGDASATKASVYAMKRTVTATTSVNYTAYALNKLCDSYYANFGNLTSAGQCEAVLTTLLGEPMSSYANPFCNIKGSGLGTWNSTCSATSTAVSAASFDDPAVTWLAPSELNSVNTVITLPTAAQ